MVVARYRFVGRDLGLLAILFPRLPVIRDPRCYSFVTAPRIIVVSEDKSFNRYIDKEVILITSSATIALDTRKGFLSVLAKLGVKATNYQLTILLNDLSDAEFWRQAKLAVLLKGFPNISPANRSTVLDLFRYLFQDFAEVYRHYWNLRSQGKRSSQDIAASVVEMMTKSMHLHKYHLHPYYRKVLKDNRKFAPLFKFAFLEFLTQGRKHDDWDVLSFFAFCSAHRRPPTSAPYLTRFDCVGSTLAQMGYKGDAETLEATFRRAFPNLY